MGKDGKDQAEVSKTQNVSGCMGPSPLDQILGLYLETGSARSFADDLAAHLRHGVVVGTAEVLVLARPVASAAPVEWINDPGHVFSASDCDAWYVYAFAGNLWAALGHFPYRLPYIAFERANQNGLRFLPLDRFIRRCHGLRAANKK